MTTTIHVEGRRVTMAAEAGVPAEIDLKGVGAGPPLALTFSPEVAAATLEEAKGDGFGGLAATLAAARRVVDIRVTGTVPPSGLKICLPVSDGLREAAAGLRDASANRDLLLLRYDDDGSVWVVEGRSLLNAAQVCAEGVTAFSPFAVGYEDMVPSFVGGFPEKLSWTVDEAIEPVTLPEAEGDGVIVYALSPALPDGVERDGRRLSGTPTVEMAVTDYTWTATDADGESQQVELEFTIEVIPALGKARARLKAINESILPELSRAR